MKKSHNSEEQIAHVLLQAEAGGMGVVKLRRLRQVGEEENRKLEQLVADLRLDKAMLQEVIAKKF